MKSFKQYIKEDKNTHLEHVEDEIFNLGYSGVDNAVNFLEGITSLLGGHGGDNYSMTVKWDGAPAIFCGTNPENGKFFVGTKSIFNKTPKINYTPADVRRNHGHSQGLEEKLLLALKYLSKLGIKGVLQGDLLFTKSDLSVTKLGGEKMLTFTPNTITYAVPSNSELAKEISGSKIGIVFHTSYKGKSIESMSASFGVNVSRLKKSKDIFFMDADFRMDSAVTMDSSETDGILSDLSSVHSKAKNITKFLNDISEDKAILPLLKIYINTNVREGSLGGDHKSFMVFVKKRIEEKIEGLTSDAGKARKKDLMIALLSKIKNMGKSLDQAFEIRDILIGVKGVLLSKINNIEGIKSFIRTGKGYKITSPEGFVAIDTIGKNAVKLVDRLEFSRINFTASKNWVKG